MLRGKKSKKIEYTQSQTPWEDPDTPVQIPGDPIPKPLPFEEMIKPQPKSKQPRFDMDSDLGA